VTVRGAPGFNINAVTKRLLCLFLSICVVQTVCACTMDFVSDCKIKFD